MFFVFVIPLAGGKQSLIGSLVFVYLRIHTGHLRGLKHQHLTVPNSKPRLALVAAGYNSISIVSLRAPSRDGARALETLNVPLSCLEIEKAGT